MRYTNRLRIANIGGATVASTPSPDRYDRTWNRGVTELGGTWDPKSGVWLFPAAAETAVRDLGERVFGTRG